MRYVVGAPCPDGVLNQTYSPVGLLLHVRLHVFTQLLLGLEALLAAATYVGVQVLGVCLSETKDKVFITWAEPQCKERC